MKSPRVLVTHRVHQEVARFLSTFCEAEINESLDPWPRQELLNRCRNAEGMLVFMSENIDAAFLDGCPKLKIISAALKGYDNFDVPACKKRNIWFTIIPDLLTEPTAELALGLLLAVTRKILAGDAYVRSGRFSGWRPHFYGRNLAGRTIGILGFGAVGRAFAQRLQGFDVRIVYYDREAAAVETAGALRARRLSFDDLLRHSDVIVPFLPLAPETIHLINATAIAKMKPGAILVNCGRGSVVDEEAVAQALATGHLGGYAADVFEMEDQSRPDAPSHIPAALLENRARTVFTPHLGSAVDEVRAEIEWMAAEQLRQAFRGDRPQYNVY